MSLTRFENKKQKTTCKRAGVTIILALRFKSWPTGYNSQNFLLIWGLSLKVRCPNFL